MRRLCLALLLLCAAAPVSAQWITYNGVQSTRTPITLVPQTQPATTAEGTFYYDRTSRTFKVYNGTAWVSVGAIAGALNLGTTSTDGVTLANTTPANATTTVQMSPRTKWCGTAWNSTSLVSETDCLFLEVLPGTAAGTTTATLKVGYVNPAGTVTYPAMLSSAGVLATTNNFNMASQTSIGFSGQGFLTGGAANGQFLLRNSTVTTGVAFDVATDQTLKILDRAAATGTEVNLGVPTLGTCTGGSLTSGSHNFGGEYTGNTSSSCVINFGTPNFTNAPFCFVMSEASTTHPRISARSASSITVTGGVSGEAIQYFCIGRIGT